MSLLGNLTVGILGNMSGLSNTFSQAQNQVSQFGRNMQKVGRDVSTIGSNLTKLVTVPIVALGGASLKLAMDFETAFTNVKKYMTGTEEEFAKMAAGIRAMAKETPFATTEIANVAAMAAQLGIEKKNVLSFSKTMLDLSVSTNLTTEAAASSLAKFANITQMPQENFQRLGSTITALGNNFAAMESDIVEMGMRLAGAGSSIGMTEAQIMGMSTSLVALGVNAEAGGSAFSKLMVDMASQVATGGKKLDGFAKVAGMTTKDFQKAFKEDAAGAITHFLEGLGKMKDNGENVFGVIDDLGLSEVRLRDALLRASGAGDLFGKSMDVATKAWKDNTELAKTSGKYYETTGNKFKTLMNRFKDIGITIGDALIPAFLHLMDSLDPLIKILEQVADWFSKLDPSIQSTIIVIAGIAAAIGPVLVVVGTLISSVGSIITAVTALSGVMTGLGAVFTFLTGPIGLTIAAIIGAAILIYKYWDPIKKFFIDLWEGIKSVGIAIWDGLKSAWNGAVDFFKKWGLTILQIVGGPFISLVVTIIKNWDSIKTFFSNLVNWFKDVWGSISGFFTDLWSGIVKIAVTIWDSVKNAWTSAINFIKEIFSPATEFFAKLWEGITTTATSIWGSVSSFLSRTWENIKTIAGAAWEIIKNVALGPILLFIDLVKGNMDEFKSHLSQIWDNIKNAAITIWNSMKDTVISYIQTLVDVAVSIWEFFVGAISGYFSAIFNTAVNIFNAVKTFFSTIWESIKTIFNNALESIKTFFKNKFEDMRTAAKQKMENTKTDALNIWNNIKTFLSNTIDAIKDTVRNKFEEMKTSVQTKMTDAKNKITEIWNGIKTFFTSIDLTQIGKDIIQGLINGIGSMASAVWEKAKSIANGIGDSIKKVLKIASPSKLMFQLGKWTGQGLDDGLDSMVSKINRTSMEIANAAIPDIPPINTSLNVGNRGSSNSSVVETSPFSIKIQPAPVILDDQLVGEILFNHVDNHFANSAQMSLYMRGERK